MTDRSKPLAGTAAPFDDTPCALGEGPLWHPGRGQLYWFDITAGRLLTRDAGHGGDTRHWQFDGTVSAAGWIDDRTLLIAGERALFTFGLDTGDQTEVCPLEADQPRTRSNDGRADPWGGFWIGTMGKAAEPEFGAIYRYYRGELRQLYAPIVIPNAICFAPDRRTAYFADSTTGKIMRQALAAGDGWPAGQPEVFIDLTGPGLVPDGAVVDAQGCLWCAHWGAAKVTRYSPTGETLFDLPLAAPQVTCPAFGGDDSKTLFVTSARQGMDAAALAAAPDSGMTFTAAASVTGQHEHRVEL